MNVKNDIMEEKKMTEKESLELVFRMIQATRQNLGKGSGNYFLVYGYMALILSVAIYMLLYVTGNTLWAVGWFLMFLPMIVIAFRKKENKPLVVTYTDSMVKKVWQVIGSLFSLTIFVMLVLMFIMGKYDFVLMLPLSLLYAGIGTAITGLVIKESCLVYGSFVGFVFAIYMLMSYTLNGSAEMIWNLYFGLSLVVMMVVPGHVLNNKIKGL